MHAALGWLNAYWPWLALTGAFAFLNTVSRVSNATWDRWATTRPKLRACLKLLRGLGVDPPAIAMALAELVAAMAASRQRPPGLAGLRDGPVPPTVTTIPPPPAEPISIYAEAAPTPAETPDAKKGQS